MRSPKKTAAPQLDDIVLDGLTAGPVTDLSKNADLDRMSYTDVQVDRLVLTGAVIAETHFAGLIANEADLQNTRLTDVVLDNVNVPVVRAARTQWRDVAVTGRLGSVEAYESDWRSVHFIGCKLSFINLRGAELLDLAFTDCVIEELDLAQARLRRVRISNTKIAQLDVQRAQLTDVDLRGADLSSITGLTELRGATISPQQLTLLAPLFAHEMGLRIED